LGTFELRTVYFKTLENKTSIDEDMNCGTSIFVFLHRLLGRLLSLKVSST
jgi:hypothetical protein